METIRELREGIIERYSFHGLSIERHGFAFRVLLSLPITVRLDILNRFANSWNKERRDDNSCYIKLFEVFVYVGFVTRVGFLMLVI